VFERRPPPVERSQDPRVVTRLGVVDRGVGLMPVDMQGAATGQVQRRIGMLIMVVAAAHDRALPGFGHHERQRRLGHLAVMQGDAVFRGHVDKHPPEPIVGDRGQQIGRQSELGATKGSRYGIAAEGNGIIARHRFLIARRQDVGEEGDVDIGLADEKSLHRGERFF
jgi:hypothetical protein